MDKNNIQNYTFLDKMKKVEELINNGCDINLKDCYGYTPLIIASMYHNKNMVILLIEKGANVNLVDIDCRTALMYTVDNYDITKLLIDSGADVNLIDINGKTALIYASQKGHLEVADFLKANGAV